MQKKILEKFYPESRKEWRQWLKRNHTSKLLIWVVMYKKKSGKPSMVWSEAVEEALCFGWIDSTRKTLDGESFVQLFTKRKPTSTWSKINKDKVKLLIADGLMMKAGLESIETAKQNGSWTKMDSVEELEIPKDLAKEFRVHPGSKKYFEGLTKSVKKMILHWLMTAKRPETREKRIKEIAELAGQGKKPKQFV